MVIIMVHAAVSRQVLPYDHHRNGKTLERALVRCREHCRNQYDAVNLFVIESRQIIDLLLRLILGDCKEHPITAVMKLRKHSLNNPPNGRRGNFGYNHANHLRPFCPQRLCLNGGPVAGLLHHLADCRLLFL